MVTTRTRIGGRPSGQRDVLVRHGGLLYDFTFFCDADHFAAAGPRVDAVMATVRWR